MSQSIEERIVDMKFNNAQFKTAVGDTLDTIGKLEKGLRLDNAADGLDDVGKNVGYISSKFTALGIAGVTALATIANKAVDVGLQVARSLTIQPVIDGFGEYELKMGSIQTILANTSRHGTTLDDVANSLDNLNEYADLTIYNFADMTKNIGLFTNAGIGLADATAMIKGFSNEAAASGTSAAGAAGAAYQLSQALSAGVIRLMDWRSLTNVGLGNKNMQNSLIEIGQAMGKFNDETTTAQMAAENFNGSLESQWLTADVMQNYLKIQAGELSKEQQLALGLTEKQIEAFSKQQQIAEDAATKVRTATQLFSVLQEAVGSSWAETFDIFLGDFNEATDFFTYVSDSLTGLLGQFGEDRNTMLTMWSAQGGRSAAIQGLYNILDAINGVIQPVVDGFKEIFSLQDQAFGLVKATQAFRDFTASLVPTEETMEKLQRTFRGVFAVVNIVVTVFKTVGNLVKTALSPLAEALGFTGGNILDLTAKIGDWLVGLDAAFQKTKFVTESVGTFADVVEKAVDWVKSLGISISPFFQEAKTSVFDGISGGLDKIRAAIDKGLNSEKFVAFRDRLSEVVDSIRNFSGDTAAAISNLFKSIGALGGGGEGDGVGIFQRIKNVIDEIGPSVSAGFAKIVDFFKSLWNTITTTTSNVRNAVGGLFDPIKDFFNSIDPDIAASTLNLGFATVAVALVRDLVQNFGGLGDIVEGFGDTLDGFQKKLKAEALLKIAVAIGVLAASIWLVAQIPADKLLDSVVALGIMGTVMVGMMSYIDQVVSDKNWVKLPVVTAAMALLGGALLLLAVAASRFADMEWDEVFKALVGLSGALAATNLARGGKVDAIALFAIALAFNALSSGIQKLADVSWEGLAKAGAVMTGLVAFMSALDKLKLDGGQMASAAAAMLILGFALTVFAGALKLYEKFSYGEFFDGMLKIAIALTVVGATLNIFPQSALKASAAMLVVSLALVVMAGAIELYSKMDYVSFFNGMLKIAIALTVIGLAMHLFPEGEVIKAAAAMAIMAVALGLLVPTIVTLGSLDWQVLALGIGAIVVAMAAIAGVSLLLSSAIIPMLAFAGALALLGAAVFLASAGFALFAVGLATLVGIGAAGAATIGLVLVELAKTLPTFAEQMAKAFVTFLQSIGDSADQIFVVVVGLIKSLLKSLRVLIPEIIDFVLDMLEELIRKVLIFLEDNTEEFVTRGVAIIAALIQGIANKTDAFVESVTNLLVNFFNAMAENLPDIQEAGTNLIVAFIEGIGKSAERIVTAAGDTLVTFLEGVEEWIRENAPRINEAGWGIAEAIIDGMVDGITGGLSRVTRAAGGIADAAVGTVKSWLGIASPSKVFKEIGEFVNEGFVDGLTGQSQDDVKRAFWGLNDILKAGISDSRAEMEKQKETLRELKDTRDKDWKAIRKTEEALRAATEENRKFTNARKELINNLQDEKRELYKLGKEYEKVTEDLSDAQDALADIRSERTDFREGIKDQYDDFASVGDDTKLEDYFAKMREQITQTNDLRAGLEQLQKLGLNDKLYRQLVEQGADALPFISQVLDGGKDAVRELNSIDGDLEKASTKLGKSSSSALYDAGVDAAAGLVEGLKERKDEISKEMEDIAGLMVEAIKKKLGIKSPSRVLAQLGRYSTEGLAKGIRDNVPTVEDSATALANATVDALGQTLREMESLVPEQLELQPMVTPVLDLSDIKSKSSGISDLIGAGKTLRLDPSAARMAASIAEDERKRSSYDEEDRETVRDVTFNQYNNSPKSLSPTEIYRNTNNQVSKAKEELTT